MTLIHEGLRLLIQREAARQLARLGASEPDAKLPPQRRRSPPPNDQGDDEQPLHVSAAMLIALATTLPLDAQEPAPQPDTTGSSVALPPDLDRGLRDYERAWRAGDVPALVALFTDDGIVLQPGRPRPAVTRRWPRYTATGRGPASPSGSRLFNGRYDWLHHWRIHLRR